MPPPTRRRETVPSISDSSYRSEMLQVSALVSHMTAMARVLLFLVSLMNDKIKHHINAITGGTNKQLDLQNPDNLGQQPTDSGNVVNFKWSFSDSKTRLLNGGWVREQVVTDLPASTDIAAAQQSVQAENTEKRC